MALVAFLKGINVGGHRRFRPSALARELEHLEVVNVGAAGTFVVRRTVDNAQLGHDPEDRKSAPGRPGGRRTGGYRDD